MAVHHLEDFTLQRGPLDVFTRKMGIVTISVYFSTARKDYLLYWNGAFWTKKFSLLDVATEINQFMKRAELPEYPGMEVE